MGGTMADKAAFHVIVLGPNGGPREDSVTGLLVRSTSTQWSPDSVVAVDAGTMLAGIIRLLAKYGPGSKNKQGVLREGPFAGLELPCETAEANAAHVFREIIGGVLITHAHLDHIAGLAINTPILEAGSGPKSVAALPSVLAAIKNHMFNDIIWPNLSDEDGGAGLLTYQRLVEGGNPRFGRGEGRGYVRACNGLLAKCLSVSHGRCKQRYHPESGMHHRVGSAVFAADQLMLPSRAISVDHTDGSFFSPARSPRLVPSTTKEPVQATVESSAFFLRDHHTGNEIIVFGDVEPDTVALEPNNKRVWETAAPKIASGVLRAIFIECSYNDSIDDAFLYGHLCPRHLVAELTVLATKVIEARESKDKKRKRDDSNPNINIDTSPEQLSPKSKRMQSVRRARQSDRRRDSCYTPSYNIGESMAEGSSSLKDNEQQQQQLPIDQGLGNLVVQDQHATEESDSPTSKDRWADANPLPLAGLSIYVIHIKESLTDGPPPGNRILCELKAHGEAARLGCEFFIPDPAEGIWI